MPTYWQIAAGSDGRDYADRFLRHGIAFVGGDTPIATMEQIAIGDVLILKQGLSTILAAGTVVARDGVHKGNGDKQWLSDFDGWHLPAYCFVDWHVTTAPISTDGLTRATIQRVQQNKHREIADALLGLPTAQVETEPFHTRPLNDDVILRFLIAQGLRPGAADDLTTTIKRIRLLAEYYTKNCWDAVGEHEARTFLVVPLLLSLGWAEQQLKIELKCSAGRIDVAGFSRACHMEISQCCLLVETKDLTSGLHYAPNQAIRYSRDFPSCHVLVVTNGYCYKTYVRSSSGEFDLPPIGVPRIRRKSVG